MHNEVVAIELCLRSSTVSPRSSRFHSQMKSCFDFNHDIQTVADKIAKAQSFFSDSTDAPKIAHDWRQPSYPGGLYPKFVLDCRQECGAGTLEVAVASCWVLPAGIGTARSVFCSFI